MADSELLYEKIINSSDEKGQQLRLVMNIFREVEYLHLRKYYQNFEGEFVPSKEGASMPATIGNMYALLDGLLEVVAKEEGIDAIAEHFGSKISDLKNKSK